MAQSGALFDIAKLHDICKNEFAKLEPQEVFDFLKNWCQTYQPDMMKVYFADDEKFMKVINLCMGIGGKRRRKDFCYAKQIFESLAMYFDETLVPSYEFSYDNELVTSVLRDYLAGYDHSVDASGWFNALKALGEKYGFTGDMKAYKADPEAYKGNVSHVAEMLRIAITGSSNSPDLWTINQILGEEVMRNRINNVIEHLK
jgi:glutamyl-tRNA synthetase